MMLYTKYESFGPLKFQTRRFFKIAFLRPIFDPLTYLCNQLEPLEQFW